MKEASIKELLSDVKRMVASGVLIQDYEVKPNSYVCFIIVGPKNKHMYHCGRLAVYSEDIQNTLMGAFLNETIEDYKVTGIYRIADYTK